MDTADKSNPTPHANTTSVEELEVFDDSCLPDMSGWSVAEKPKKYSYPRVVAREGAWQIDVSSFQEFLDGSADTDKPSSESAG